MSRISLPVLGLAVVFPLGAIAQIAQEATSVPLLQNITNAVTIFHDDFESMPVTEAPEALQSPSFGTPLIGNWAATGITNPENIEVGVTNEARSGVVPQQGEKFFMLSTDAGAVAGQAWTGRGSIETSLHNDTIEANVAFYLTSKSNQAFVYLYGGHKQNRLLAALCLNGKNPLLKDYSLAYHDGTEFQQTQLRFKPDTWNTLTVRHTNGTSDWEVSINGEKTVTVTGYQDSTGLHVNAIYFNQTTDSARGTTVYYDAVALDQGSASQGKR